MSLLPPPPVPARPDLVEAAPPPDRRRPAWVVVVATLLVASLVLAALVPFLDGESATADRFAFLSRTPAGEPVRWNPCEPIHYVVNVSHAPPGSLADVHEAVRRISDATGIPWIYDGLSDESPSRVRDAFVPARYGERWAPVLIGWVDPDSSDIPFEADGEVASAVASPLYPNGAWDLYVSGWVAMNEEDPNTPGFDDPWDQGPVLLHELGHVVGLGHVDAYGEIMEQAGGGVTDLGEGDREGLRRLGSAQGCLAVPLAHA
jgi:hypothetical protein